MIKNKNLLKDITLLKSEAERCRDILLSFSKNPYILKDNFFEKIKIEDLIKLSFEKFNTHKELNIVFDDSSKDMSIIYKDELIIVFSNIIHKCNSAFYK